MPITEIIDSQMPSLTEWLEKINFANTEEFRHEDNTKRDRLEILSQEIGIEYEKPEKFSARDLKDHTHKFQDYLDKFGNEQCALRLMPTTPGLPKLRVRGKTLNENLIWFEEQNIDVDLYKVEIIPHSDFYHYSSTFLINDYGITGEIISGLHWQLTQGLHKTPLIYFSYDFKDWHFSNNDPAAQAWAKEGIASLLIDKTKQENLAQKMKVEFSTEGYLKGYFEFIVWINNKISFIDYNRIILNLLRDIKPTSNNSSATLSGICASPGKVTGTARIISNPNYLDFQEGDILICEMTTIDYIPLMKKSGGIITKQGSILCHAAIVGRELKKPCLVGVKDALTQIKDGQNITLDADSGQIILN